VPVIHGAGVTGMQGMGVNTPKAAAVAAATAGLLGVMHMPNGIMLTIGTWSMMLAAGILLVSVRLIGRTLSVLGAIPKVHIRVAPEHTCIGIVTSFVFSDYSIHFAFDGRKKPRSRSNGAINSLIKRRPAMVHLRVADRQRLATLYCANEGALGPFFESYRKVVAVTRPAALAS